LKSKTAEATTTSAVLVFIISPAIISMNVES